MHTHKHKNVRTHARARPARTHAHGRHAHGRHARTHTAVPQADAGERNNALTRKVSFTRHQNCARFLKVKATQ